MKFAQITGLLLTVWAFSYYYSFAHFLTPENEKSIALGLGLLGVFVLLGMSAVLLIPSSFVLWSKKARAKRQFNLVWNIVLGINSVLAIVYSTFAVQVVFGVIQELVSR